MKTVFSILAIAFLCNKVEGQSIFKDLTVVQFGDSVLVDWTLSAGSTCFDMHLQRAAPATEFEQVYTVSGVCGGATDQFYDFIDFSGLVSGTTYQYMISASNGTFASDPVSILYVNAGEQPLLIYPNPSTSDIQVTVDNNYTPSFLVELYTLQGQMLMQTVRLQRLFTVNTGVLTAGIYLLKITTESGDLLTQQVIVQ